MEKECKECKNKFVAKSKIQKFCSRNCSTRFNNRGVRRHGTGPLKYNCLNCGKEKVAFKNKAHHKMKFCDVKCQNDYKHKRYIQKWLNEEENGSKGLDGVSGHIRRYLFEKHNSKCVECGWSVVNQYTGLIPLHIEHIDGNHKNNRPDNLKLLCPNCHSLTSTFGSRNKGNGRQSLREWRKKEK